MTEQKRRRTVSQKKLTTNEPKSTPTTEQTVEAVVPEETWLTESGEFDWEGYQATCITHTRNANPHVKTSHGEKVYSKEKYAQELYDLITGHTSTTDLRTSLNIGDIIDGKIFGVTEEWMTVDANYRELVYVKLSKEPRYIKEDYSPGNDVSVLITDNTDQVIGSVSGGMKQRVFRDLQQGVEDGDTAWIGKVENMIENGGYIINIQGVQCFMPGSLAGINKLHNFNSIIGEDIYVVPVSFSPERGTIVVSHRKYLQAMIPGAIKGLKAHIDKQQSGHVTGTAKYGVFCEFNDCLTGMIHVNDLDEETSSKFKSRSIKPGDPIQFYVKDIISNTKITLSQKADTIHNPWKDVDSRYKVPCNVEATVKTKKDYGLFITVEEGLVGLLHVSELDESVMNLYNPGDTITVQINRIDKDSQKIFLKLPS